MSPDGTIGRIDSGYDSTVSCLDSERRRIDMRWKKGVGGIALGAYSDAFSGLRLVIGSKNEPLDLAWLGAPGGEAIGES
ncbi:MAG: hypothetical protein FJ308_16600 [Planctomycetes bacterium]|nr:hypothetical protein [Planctomycetota bacterium]